jgi:hypothetical protein
MQKALEAERAKMMEEIKLHAVEIEDAARRRGRGRDCCALPNLQLQTKAHASKSRVAPRRKTALETQWQAAEAQAREHEAEIEAPRERPAALDPAGELRFAPSRTARRAPPGGRGRADECLRVDGGEVAYDSNFGNARLVAWFCSAQWPEKIAIWEPSSSICV